MPLLAATFFYLFIVAFLFYPPVHEVERLREIFPDVIIASSPEQAPPPPAVPVVIHGTGGTTQAVVEYLKNSKGAVLVAFGEHNSLASALHTRAELEAMGVPSVLLTCERASECAGILKKAEKIAEAASAVYGARVLLVGRAGFQAEIARLNSAGWWR